MKTFHRVCIEDHKVSDGEKTAKVEKGKEYLTSEEYDGMVTVLDLLWFKVPVDVFETIKQFTE